MPTGGVPDWFGKDEDPKPRRRRAAPASSGTPSGGADGGGAAGGGDPSKLRFAAIGVLVLAGAGAYVGFKAQKESNAQARAKAEQRAQRIADEKATAEEQRQRMLAEIKLSAEATPEPEAVDPSTLPAIEDELADTDDAGEADEATVDAGALGTRDSAAVLRVTRALNPKVQRCYANELAKDPDVRGRALVNLTISAEGNVSKVTVVLVGQLPEAMRGCIAGVYTTARFEPAKDAATVRLPLAFSAR